MFIVRILAEDLAGWELEHTTAGFYHYRPQLAGEVREQIQVMSPAPLDGLVGRDMFCFVNVEKGWLSKKIGAHPEVKFKLKVPTEALRDPRRVRLKIKQLDTSQRPPRVLLADLDISP